MMSYMIAVKRVIKRIVSVAFYASGAWYVYSKVKQRREVRVPILMYHSVSEGGKGSVSRKRFEEQMGYLKQHYRPISLGHLVRMLRSGERPDGERYVVLTFDDGFKDNYDVAWPVLRRYGFPAVMFIPTDYIGRENAWEQADGIPVRPLLEEREVRVLAAHGADIGAHSCSHPRLTTLSIEEVVREVKTSRHILEGITGKSVSLFAYPYGSFSSREETLVRQLGFACACSTVAGTFHTPRDLYRLSRIDVEGEDTLLDFRWKLEGRVDWLRAVHMFKRWLRRRTPVGAI